MSYAKIIAGVYMICNAVNGHCYVGSSVNLQRRKYEHFRELRRGIHINTHLQRAFNAYGHAAFTFHIVEVIIDHTALIVREQHYIDILLPEYNIVPLAGNTLGYKHTLESRQKISQANLAYQITDEHRMNISLSLKGKPKSAEHGKKISEVKKGKPLSEKNRIALDAVHQTEEYHRKLSAWQIGKKLSPEHRQKLSEKRRLRPPASEETRHKLSESLKATLKNKVISEEEHQRRVDANKSAWERKSEEEKAKARQVLRENRPPRTEEARRKQSETMKAKWAARKAAQQQQDTEQTP